MHPSAIRRFISAVEKKYRRLLQLSLGENFPGASLAEGNTGSGEKHHDQRRLYEFGHIPKFTPLNRQAQAGLRQTSAPPNQLPCCVTIRRMNC